MQTETGDDMTELATHGKSETQPGAFLSHSNDPGILHLTGNQSQKVYVSQVSEGNTPLAGFALDPSGPFYTGGIEWQSGEDFSKFITFVFAPGIVQINCELPYSAPYGLNNSNQDLCLYRVVDAGVTYQAFVTFGSGARHDPRIIVTPINGM
jgi:hypothetical protein